MPRTLTDEQRAAYVANGGLHCPFCGETVEAGPLEAGEVDRVYSSVECSCGAEWTDVYRLDSILLPEE